MKARTLPSFTLPMRMPRLKPGLRGGLDWESAACCTSSNSPGPAHAAFTQFGDDFVRTESIARGEAHGMAGLYR